MFSRPRILIVDDEEIVWRNYERILLGEGYDISVATGGEEAVKIIREETFDLILTDLVMERVDGIKVLEEVKRISPDTVVIIVTGYGSLTSAVKAMQKGALDYLVKPCEKDELIMRVHKGIERRHMEQKLNELKKVETIMSNIGVFTLNTDALFLHSNPNIASRIWNMSTLDGKSLYDLPFTEESGLTEGFNQALEGKNVDREMLRLVRENADDDLTLSVHFRPVIKEDGEVTAVTLIVEEISQRVKVIEKISQAERLAALGKLAAGVAHEINNPLNIISLDAEFMKSHIKHDDPCMENLKSIAEEVDRIAFIIQQLQDHVKCHDSNCDLIDLNHLLREHIFSITFDQLSRKQVAVKLDLYDNLPMVQISKTKLTQVLMNLIKNAEDAMATPGNLTISTQPVFSDKNQEGNGVSQVIDAHKTGMGDFVSIKIQDTGVGIPKENFNCLFEPFFTTKGFEGTGLGLFISYSIIKSYNGSISVSSEPGVGTEFSVVLPSVSPHNAPRPC